MSRSERFSCSTRPASQRNENGASVSWKPRLGAQQHRLAGPDLGQPQLVHRHRQVRGGTLRVLQEDDLLLGVDPGQQRRAAVGEQQHHRARSPAAACRWRQLSRTARAHIPAFCAHSDSDGGRRSRLAWRAAELVRVEFDPVIAAGQDHGLQPRDGQLRVRPGPGSGRPRGVPAATAYPPAPRAAWSAPEARRSVRRSCPRATPSETGSATPRWLDDPNVPMHGNPHGT